MKFRILSLLYFLCISAFSQLECDYSIDIIGFGDAAFVNDTFVFLPFCESNELGNSRVDIKVEVCRTPDTCYDNLRIYFNGQTPWPISFDPSDDSCRRVTAINRPYASEIEICLGQYAGTTYIPIVDPNSENDCVTINVDLQYCEEGCFGDSCAPDLPVFSNNGWTYPTAFIMDNADCWDELDNANINFGEDCGISVENTV